MWISFVGRSSRNIVHLPNSQKESTNKVIRIHKAKVTKIISSLSKAEWRDLNMLQQVNFHKQKGCFLSNIYHNSHTHSVLFFTYKERNWEPDNIVSIFPHWFRWNFTHYRMTTTLLLRWWTSFPLTFTVWFSQWEERKISKCEPLDSVRTFWTTFMTARIKFS